ncbi:MAG: M23 family metallopeptidase [Gaiellaceae bacterium]
MTVATVQPVAHDLQRGHVGAASSPLGTTGSPSPVARSPRVRPLDNRPVFPFPPSPALRRPSRADLLPSLWADGLACSVGCRPVGAIAGWPLKPFHGQHALRAGLNERRPGSLHEGLDIQARDGQRVYAIQPGYAHILVPSGGEARVRIGNFIYWHVAIAVKEGQYVKPYSTLVGRVNRHRYGHLHLSEVTASGAFLNPLRPGGRVLSPWRDTAAPVIGRPRLLPDGRVLVRAFDPQSFDVRTTYETPVLAPAGLGYQVFDSHGRRDVPLHWSLRSNRVLPGTLAASLYAPDAKEPGFSCFATRLICKPNWDFVLAGGLAPRLGGLGLVPGRYRLSVYAWDYAGNVTARDKWFRVAPGDVVSAAARPASE